MEILSRSLRRHGTRIIRVEGLVTTFQIDILVMKSLDLPDLGIGCLGYFVSCFQQWMILRDVESDLTFRLAMMEERGRCW